VRRSPGTTKARQLIVQTSLEYLRRLAADAGGDPELALELGNAYMRVARVQGVPISTNLGQMDQAEQNLRIAGGFIGSVLASRPANRTAMLRSAQIAHDRMLLARFGHTGEALVLAQQSAEWLEKFHAGKGDESEAAAVLSTYLNVADQHMLGEQYDEALRLCRLATETALALGNRSYLGTYLETSAEVFRRRGNLEEALHEIREAVSKLDFGPAAADQNTASNFALALIKEGRILGDDEGISMGRSEEAVVPLERAFRIADDFAHRDPNDQASRGRVAMAGLIWAHILRHADARRSLEIYDHVLRHLAEFENNSSFRRYEVSALAGSSYALLRLARPAEARKRLDTAATVLRELGLYPTDRIPPGSESEQMLCALADYEATRGEVPRAIEIYDGLLRKLTAGKPKPETSLPDAFDLSRLHAILAALNRRTGREDRAASLEAWRLNLWQNWNARVPNSSFVRRQLGIAKASNQ
jgi:tetratricopeptide (TPR) repeat protein